MISEGDRSGRAHRHRPAHPRRRCGRPWHTGRRGGHRPVVSAHGLRASGSSMELVVGRIAKAHGVTGELSVEVRTDDPDERFAVGSVLTGRLPRGGGSRRFTVESVREHSGRLLIRFAGVSDRDAADALREPFSWWTPPISHRSRILTSSTITSSKGSRCGLWTGPPSAPFPRSCIPR